MNRLRPDRPVSALMAAVHAPHVVWSHGSCGSRVTAAASKVASVATGACGPFTTCHQTSESFRLARLPRTASQKASSAARPMACKRSLTEAKSASCSRRALRWCNSASSKRAGARDKRPRSTRVASAASEAIGRTASDDPTSTASEAAAMASSPSSRKEVSDKCPMRLDRPSPLALVNRL